MFSNSFRPASLLFLLILALGFVIPNNVYSQQRRSSITGQRFKVTKKKKRMPLNYLNAFHVVGGGNFATYSGDLCQGLTCFKPTPSFSLEVQYRYSQSLTFRLGGSYNRLRGNDARGEYAYRGLSFFSNTFGASASVVYDIFEYNKMYRRRHDVSPYLTVGFGILSINPKARLDGEKYALRPMQTEEETYGNYTFTIPYGGGARFKLSPVLNLATEIIWMPTFTDYIDDVAGRYNTELEPNSIAARLSDRRQETGLAVTDQEKYGGQRGGGRNDWVWSINFKFEYTFHVTRQRYNINTNKERFRLIKSIKKR